MVLTVALVEANVIKFGPKKPLPVERVKLPYTVKAVLELATAPV
jgi:hypothetical protein